MNPNSTHRSAIWMSVAILCFLSATAVLADGPGPKPPKNPPKDPVTRRSPDPPPSPEKPKPETPKDSPVAGPVNPTPPPAPPQSSLWWWISAAILLLLLLFFLFWILRRRKPSGYVTPPSRPTYPPVDQSPRQTRPDQY